MRRLITWLLQKLAPRPDDGVTIRWITVTIDLRKSLDTLMNEGQFDRNVRRHILKRCLMRDHRSRKEPYTCRVALVNCPRTVTQKEVRDILTKKGLMPAWIEQLLVVGNHPQCPPYLVCLGSFAQVGIEQFVFPAIYRIQNKKHLEVVPTKALFGKETWFIAVPSDS